MHAVDTPEGEPGISKRTFFSELEAIDLILKIVDLVDETLHSRDIVHTNLNPQEIFLRRRSLEDLCFQRLYFCHWDAQKTLGFKALHTSASDKVIPHEKENMSVYNVKVRNKDYISPEQVRLGQELDEILAPKNGRLLPAEDSIHLHYATEV